SKFRKMKITHNILTTLLALGLASSGAIAATTFGTLSGATFGGKGIPNDSVTITTIVDGGLTITLGLTATPRFSNPAVSTTGLDSNNVGIYYAVAGGDIDHGKPNYAKWNVSFEAQGLTANYSISLLYDREKTE